jgi:hypothetical protein
LFYVTIEHNSLEWEVMGGEGWNGGLLRTNERTDKRIDEMEKVDWK